MAIDAMQTAFAGGAVARPSFAGMVRGEWLKITRQRALWWIGLGTIVMVLLRGLILLPELLSLDGQIGGNAVRFSTPDLAYILLTQAMPIVQDISGLFIMVASIIVIAQEYQMGTIRVLLARGAGRVRLLGAKALALLIVGVAAIAVIQVIVGLIMVLVSVIVRGDLSLITMGPGYYWNDAGTFLLSSVVNMVASALLAGMLAVIGRSLAFGLGIALPYFFAESIIASILDVVTRATNHAVWYNITTFFFGVNLSGLATAIIPPRSMQLITRGALTNTIPGTITIDSTHALLVIGLYSVAFAVVAILVTLRRDVTQ